MFFGDYTAYVNKKRCIKLLQKELCETQVMSLESTSARAEDYKFMELERSDQFKGSSSSRQASRIEASLAATSITHLNLPGLNCPWSNCIVGNVGASFKQEKCVNKKMKSTVLLHRC